ncbi:MAG: hypothetical protein HYR49_00440 [Gammaproteobacteria bacterium]|nr:hypothetical protein [Gammaproteobacteria bacterium]
MRGYRTGFKAQTTLRRADFGIAYEPGPTTETLEFDLFVEGIRKQPPRSIATPGYGSHNPA